MTRFGAAIPDVAGDVLLDGELVIWQGGRLAFEALLTRLNRTPATAQRLAAELSANCVAFDLLHYGDTDLLTRPYRERRKALEGLFADLGLGPPWTLCPVSTDPDEIVHWLTAWTAVGVEGACFKDPEQRYLPGRRAWLKFRVRASTEAVIGAVTGSLTRPTGLLLGRFDRAGQLRYNGRTTSTPRSGPPAPALPLVRISRTAPRNVLIRFPDHTATVRPFRGLRRIPTDP